MIISIPLLYLSIIRDAFIILFIGLTILFWGILFTFILPEEYVKSNLLSDYSISSIESLDEMMNYVGVKGKGVYISIPKKSYLYEHIGNKDLFIYLSKKDITFEELLDESLKKDPNGIRITPIGLELSKLIENNIPNRGDNIDLEYVLEFLSSIIVNELQLASNLIIEQENNEIIFKMHGLLLNKLCLKINHLDNICNNIGCPISSSIACIISKTTGNPITIEKCVCEQNMHELKIKKH